MTLAQLINEAMHCGRKFSSSWIPLKLDGQEVEISFTPKRTKDSIGWEINLNIEKR